MKDLIKQKVIDYTPELLKYLDELVSYPSVFSDDALPFGQANIDCLNHALEIGSNLGFKAVNVDNYAGYIEIGQGDEVIGIVGHLDVVPVSDTWKTDPFRMTLIDGKYYGRGTSDDKGGVLCGLIAMKIVNELVPDMNKRIRLIMGCNEESGSACLRYYVKKCGAVDCGFTPDGSFPIVFGEKGMVGATLKAPTTKILDVRGGTARNAVCASVTIELPANSFDQSVLYDYLDENGLDHQITKGDTWKLRVFGRAAHASTPEEGLNAISYTMEGLYRAGIDDEFVNTYHQLVGTGYYGEKAGVDFSDNYGRLTFNIGVIKKVDDTVETSIDIRFPVTMKKEPVIEALQKNGKGNIINIGGVDPLFFPLEHPMIKAMLKAYYDVTDSQYEPLTMGGGTYARTMPNIVAFGCDTLEYNWHIHDDNEFVTLKSLQTQTEVYANALLNLLEI